jgi:flagellar assembly protein FliH
MSEARLDDTTFPPDTSGFIVGLPSRSDAAASAMARAASSRTPGFTPAELIARLEEAFGGEPGPRPRHFAPADPDANPTAGWNPLDADAPTTPFVDPLNAARAAGYDEGYAAALADMQADAGRDRALLSALTDSLRAAAGVDRDQLAERLRATVLLLVQRLVGEVGVAPALLAARVAAATELLADASESAMLRVHPDDVALLEGALPPTVFAVGDAGVARGSFVMESASTIVEDGPDLWLEQLGAAIDRAGLPPC